MSKTGDDGFVRFQRVSEGAEGVDRIWKVWNSGGTPVESDVRHTLGVIWRRALWMWLWMRIRLAIEVLEWIGRLVRIARAEDE